MYVVIVFFEIKPAHVAAFRTAMLTNARSSLEKERGCRQFDVAEDPLLPGSFFLYEIYDDEAAFRAHLEMAHYAEFATRVEPWVASKKVLTYRLISGAGPAAPEPMLKN
jgi:autoinducer 2-degrading protein